MSRISAARRFGGFARGRQRVRLVIVVASILVVSAGSIGAQAGPFDSGLELYRQNLLQKAKPYFEQQVREHPDDADGRAYLAETLRRLGDRKGAIEHARVALAFSPCHAFAHDVLAAAYNPVFGDWAGADTDSTWLHLNEAVKCDPGDGSAWMSIWAEALHRGNRSLEEKALRSLVDRGFLTPTALAYARWMLTYLPPNALLLTNGDMDTYPPLAVQLTEGLRPDVAVVNVSLLNLPWYGQLAEKRHRISTGESGSAFEKLEPFENAEGRVVTVSTQVVRGWLEGQASGTVQRPITAAVTIPGLDFIGGEGSHFTLAGPYWIYTPGSTAEADTTVLRRCLAGVDPSDFAGRVTSAADRSPIRTAHSDKIVTNVTAAALKYAGALIEDDRSAEALNALKWAEGFENGTRAGPVLTEEIAELRKTAEGETD